MVKRSGAKIGESVYVTGTIGDSGGGLSIFRGATHSLAAQDYNFLVDAYRLPKPPVRFGQNAEALMTSAIDVSDGLMADLGHLAESSGVKIVIDGSAVPRSSALRALWGEGPDALVRAVTAGDDYQIAFTTSTEEELIQLDAASAGGVLVTRIGRVEAGEGVRLMLDGKEIPVPRPGYRHF
jgi:thiamine-monophosphate kinase